MSITYKNELTKTDSARTGQLQEQAIPYWFSNLARERGEALRVRDAVRVSGLDNRYWITDIFPESGRVILLKIGGKFVLNVPWGLVRPWKSKAIRSDTAMKAIGNWLFQGSRVYRLSEPNRMLKTVRINWDSETTDVQSQDGTVFYGISWNDLDFWNPEDYHLPDDE